MMIQSNIKFGSSWGIWHFLCWVGLYEYVFG